MPIFKEIPPTAEFPLFFPRILSAIGKKNAGASLENDLKEYLGVSHARIACSGTAAFFLILEALKSASTKKTVIIPAYICPSVAMAILRAGLVPCACDIDRQGFAIDPIALEEICSRNGDMLAIVVAHLGGIPCDMARLKTVADKYGVPIVEDCAQALGAEYHGKKVGAWGDFSFFSFARGKGLTIYEGGMAIANNGAYAERIDDAASKYITRGGLLEALRMLQLAGYWVFYRPSLFWFAYSLPELFWRATGAHLKAISEHFELDFPLHRVSDFRDSVGHAHFSLLDAQIENQRQKASRYINDLRASTKFDIVTEEEGSKATYPFLTILFHDLKDKAVFMRKMTRRGLGVSELYTLPVTEYEYCKGLIKYRTVARADDLSRRQAILSTSFYLKDKDMASIITGSSE